MNRNFKPILSRDTMIKPITNKYLIINPKIPTWTVLNKDGFYVVKFCNGKNSMGDIIEMLSKQNQESRESTEKVVIDFLAELFERNILEKDIEMDVRKKIKEKNQFSLRKLWLNVTFLCNFLCKHCYIEDNSHEKKELDLEEIRRLAKQMRKLKRNVKSQNVILTGGEPLLREDIWEICKIFKDEDIKVVLLTNGSLMDSENVESIIHNIDHVQISLDGLKKTNDKIRGDGAFEMTLRGINLLIEHGINPSIAITANKMNVKELPQLLNFLQDLSISKVIIRPVIIIGNALKNRNNIILSNRKYIKLFEKIYENVSNKNIDPKIRVNSERFFKSITGNVRNIHGCSAGIDMCSIDSTGDVYPCVATTNKELCTGSIRKSSLIKIWDESPIFEKWRNFDINNTEICGKCIWRNYCGGGCKLNSILRYGNINAPDVYCYAYKNLYETTIMKCASKSI